MEYKKNTGKYRYLLGLFLLSLLVMCACIGTQEESVQMVSASVVRTKYESIPLEVETVSGTKERLRTEREKEIRLLQNVADRLDTGETVRNDALRQLTQMVERMDTEARVQAGLEEMGYEQVLALSDARGLTLICSAEDTWTEKDRIRMIDASSSISGYAAGDIKIILAKK